MVEASVAAIPVEFREAARVTLEGGEYSCSLKMAYTRPETEAEAARRKLQSKIYQEQREAYDRREYERLKSRFEPKD